jgi:hypothetical protein
MSSFGSESAAATNSSATSIRSSRSFGAGACQISTQIKNDELEAENEDDSLENCEEQSKNGTSSSDRSEQVLIVRDTGATPTMSPNPDFERKRRSKELGEKSGGLSTDSPVKKNTKNEKGFDLWLDDGWDELSPNPRRQQPCVNGPATGSLVTLVQSSKSPPSLPPMSTIPCLATVNLAGPAAQQMSAWMGTVGKKLGDIRGSSTFTKGQKRASLLLSDMQNTFVSSLISPTPLSPPPSASITTQRKPPVIDPIFASNASMSQTTSTSLLDEIDGPLTGRLNAALLPTPVLVPPTSNPLPALWLETKEGGSKGESESDDDWNW